MFINNFAQKLNHWFRRGRRPHYRPPEMPRIARLKNKFQREITKECACTTVERGPASVPITRKDVPARLLHRYANNAIPLCPFSNLKGRGESFGKQRNLKSNRISHLLIHFYTWFIFHCYYYVFIFHPCPSGNRTGEEEGKKNYIIFPLQLLLLYTSRDSMRKVVHVLM